MPDCFRHQTPLVPFLNGHAICLECWNEEDAKRKELRDQLDFTNYPPKG